jgi:hypothetical protein
MGPRRPTATEKAQLIRYCCARHYDQATAEEREAEHDCVERAAIAVFDHYITDGPGYAGKILLVVWSGSPGFHEVYTWQNDVLTICEQE